MDHGVGSTPEHVRRINVKRTRLQKRKEEGSDNKVSKAIVTSLVDLTSVTLLS